MNLKTEPGAMELWQLRKALLGLLQENRVPQDVAQRLLSQCGHALSDSALVEAIARTLDYGLSGFQSDEALGLYYDVARGDAELGYISKGWDDPGFRLGDILDLPPDAIEAFRQNADTILEICASQLVAVGVRSSTASFELDLTIPIYEGGLNPETFSAAFDNLSECARRVREVILGA